MLILAFVMTLGAVEDGTLVWPNENEAILDARFRHQRDTNTQFAMTPFASLSEWESFAAGLRRRILVSSGLLPLPERAPLNAHIEEVARHEDYLVEKVYFEAHPGFLATGNLYRPVGEGPFPGVACPHGHWGHGRLEDAELGSVPGRCITLARMGAVAFSYDMVAYNDSVQIADHRWQSPRDALWGVHPFALQLWTSIRALDFLESLPYVDKERLACTGASGGGTQTFALMAVDPRVKVAAPVNMISCSMQGGCVCENAPILRMNASNMEIGALMAPRPLLLVSATGDWTAKTPEIEYPAIRGIYDLYGAADRAANVHIEAEHNYNKASREAMYRFFGRWLLNEPEKFADFAEPGFEVEPVESLRVFPDGKRPEGYADGAAVIESIILSTGEKWGRILPRAAADLDYFRRQYGVALNDVTGATASEPATVSAKSPGIDEGGAWRPERLVIGRENAEDAIPALLWQPAAGVSKPPVLVVHGEGKAALVDQNTGGPGPLLTALLAQGRAVLAIDVFQTGEHIDRGPESERPENAFPDTFLPTITANRIQDVLVALAYLRGRAGLGGQPELVGLGDGGVWCLFASAIDGEIQRTVADVTGFDPSDDNAWVERFYVPCIRAIGDVHTAAALIAPRAVVLCGTEKRDAWQRAFDTHKACGGGAESMIMDGSMPAEQFAGVLGG